MKTRLLQSVTYGDGEEARRGMTTKSALQSQKTIQRFRPLLTTSDIYFYFYLIFFPEEQNNLLYSTPKKNTPFQSMDPVWW